MLYIGRLAYILFMAERGRKDSLPSMNLSISCLDYVARTKTGSLIRARKPQENFRFSYGICDLTSKFSKYLGWFSMLPLPRLHHHDILTIVELFFILTIVELLNRARRKLFCHILTQTPFPSPSPNPNCNTTPWPFGYKALLMTVALCYL